MRAKSVYIVGELNHDALNKFLEAFPKADAKPGPIYVYIISEGGEVDIGLAMYEVMRTSLNPIITVGIGGVSSMAVLLLMAGDHRAMTASSNLLIHDGTVTIQGGLHAAKAHMDQNYEMHSWYCQEIATRSGSTVEDIMKLASKETFLPAAKALELGLIDSIKAYRDFMVTPEDTDESASCCNCNNRSK